MEFRLNVSLLNYFKCIPCLNLYTWSLATLSLACIYEILPSHLWFISDVSCHSILGPHLRGLTTHTWAIYVEAYHFLLGLYPSSLTFIWIYLACSCGYLPFIPGMYHWSLITAPLACTCEALPLYSWPYQSLLGLRLWKVLLLYPWPSFTKPCPTTIHLLFGLLPPYSSSVFVNITLSLACMKKTLPSYPWHASVEPHRSISGIWSLYFWPVFMKHCDSVLVWYL